MFTYKIKKRSCLNETALEVIKQKGKEKGKADWEKEEGIKVQFLERFEKSKEGRREIVTRNRINREKEEENEKEAENETEKEERKEETANLKGESKKKTKA